MVVPSENIYVISCILSDVVIFEAMAYLRGSWMNQDEL